MIFVVGDAECIYVGHFGGHFLLQIDTGHRFMSVDYERDRQYDGWSEQKMGTDSEACNVNVAYVNVTVNVRLWSSCWRAACRKRNQFSLLRASKCPWGTCTAVWMKFLNAGFTLGSIQSLHAPTSLVMAIQKINTSVQRELSLSEVQVVGNIRKPLRIALWLTTVWSEFLKLPEKLRKRKFRLQIRLSEVRMRLQWILLV